MAPPGDPADALHPVTSLHLRSSLLLLLIAEAPRHGYELMERLAALGFERDPGGLYRALRSMERDGLVGSHWEVAGSGPGRRRYHITPIGCRRLDDDAGLLKQTRTVVELYLERYQSLMMPRTGVAVRQVAG